MSKNYLLEYRLQNRGKQLLLGRHEALGSIFSTVKKKKESCLLGKILKFTILGGKIMVVLSPQNLTEKNKKIGKDLANFTIPLVNLA